MKIPASFETDIKATKWSERKEALQGLFKVLNVPKIENADFGDVTRLLTHVIAKDSNVLNVAFAANCLGALAAGLRTQYSSYAVKVAETLLEKFKEKKLNVVTALHGALERVLAASTMEKLADICVAAMKHKNPSVRMETCTTFSKHLLAESPAMPKPVIKAIFAGAAENLTNSVVTVRDAAANLLAAMLKVAGAKAVEPLLNGIDPAKSTKVHDIASTLNTLGATAKPAKKAAAAKPKTSATVKSKSIRGGAGKGVRASTKAAKPARAAAGVSQKRSAKAASTKASSSKASSSKALATTAADAAFADMGIEDAWAAVKGLGVTDEMAEQLKSSVWKERLAACTSILGLVEGSSDLPQNSALAFFRVAATSTKEWKESNFQVFSTTFEILTAATKACDSIPDRALHICISGLADKLADIKIRPAATECLNTFAEHLSLNYVGLLLCKTASGHRNPKVLGGVMDWLTQALNAFGMKIAAKPHLAFAREVFASRAPVVIKNTAATFCGALRIHGGASIVRICEAELSDHMTAVSAQFAKVDGDTAPEATRFYKAEKQESQSGGAADEDEDDAVDGAGEQAKEAEAAEDNVDRVDLMASLDNEVVTNLGDKGWKVRAQALEDIATALKRAAFITPTLGGLPPALLARLKDSNKNLVTTTLVLIGNIAAAMGRGIKRFATDSFIAGIYETLADNKESVRNAGLKAMDSIYESIGLGPFVDADMVGPALRSGKPNEQTSLLVWINKCLEGMGDSKCGNLKGLVKSLFVCLEDRSKDVRKAASDILPHMVTHIGHDKMKKAASQLKGAAQTMVMDAIKDTATSASAPVKKAAASTTATASAPRAAKTTKSIKSTSRAGSKAKLKTGRSSKSIEVPSDSQEPFMMDEKAKVKRLRDEKKLLKWNFTTPRQEFVDQLQDQFKGSVSTELNSQLFHADFKMHVKALDTITKAVQPVDGEPAPFAQHALLCIDLLLKWTTLRFFDTNPTVQIKTMQFIQELFSTLATEDGELTDQDAGVFLPYLINQSGAKLESIRQTTHAICRTICKSYPSSKLFVYLLEGLKSKNAKQRTECLAEINYMIVEHGMSVCQIGAAKSMKIVAAQISDRDNAVRTGALEVVLTVYNFMGNDVYKLMGAIGDKNTSLVQERIKRHGKHKDTQGDAGSSAASKLSVTRRSTANSGPTRQQKVAKAAAAVVSKQPVVANSNIPQQFSLDLKSSESNVMVSVDKLGLAPTDFEDLEIVDAHAPPEIPANVYDSPAKVALAAATAVYDDFSSAGAVENIISKIGDSVPENAITALKLAEDRFKQDPADLVPRADKVLAACTDQLHVLFSTHFDSSDVSKTTEAVRLCKHLIGFVLQIFKSDAFAENVSPESLQNTVVALLTYVQDSKLERLEEGRQVTRALNLIILKILQSVQPNLGLSMLMGVLSDVLNTSSNEAQMIQLVQRCMWKLVKAFPETIANIDISGLLVRIAEFFRVVDTTPTNDGADALPVRTVRPIVQQVVKLKGEEAGECLASLEDTQHDQLVRTMVVQAMSAEGLPVPAMAASAITTNVAAPAVATLSNGEKEEQLVTIFAMITSKEETKQGMMKLYEFQERQPQTNFTKFLDTVSPFFQNHIKRSLEDIRKRKAQLQTMSSTTKTGGQKSASNYLDQLRKLTAKPQGAGARDPLVTVQARSFTSTSMLPESVLPAVARSPPRVSPTKADVSQLDSLKARLARFKSKK